MTPSIQPRATDAVFLTAWTGAPLGEGRAYRSIAGARTPVSQRRLVALSELVCSASNGRCFYETLPRPPAMPAASASAPLPGGGDDSAHLEGAGVADALPLRPAAPVGAASKGVVRGAERRLKQ